MTSLFSYLHSSLKVTPLDGDQVKVTVTLPSDLFLDYLRVLDSLTGFVRTLRSKSQLAKPYQPDPHQLQQRDDYYRRIVAAFDEYTAQGYNRTQAIKQISAELRTENHPWSSIDLVRTALTAAGRPGRSRRQS